MIWNDKSVYDIIHDELQQRQSKLQPEGFTFVAISRGLSIQEVATKNVLSE